MYYRAFEGMNPTISAASEEVVQFDSHFESANLDCAIRVRPDEYDLFLRVDSNTRGHTQWFYFSASSRCARSVRLNICNLTKDSHLYRKVCTLSVTQGMRPYLFSVRQNHLKGTTWEQGGTDIKFEEKKLRYRFLYERSRVRRFWKLSFRVTF